MFFQGTKFDILENDNKYKDYKVNHINYEIDEMFNKAFKLNK